MAWLKSTFRRDQEDSVEREVVCSHMNLTPPWDDPADVGNSERTSGYTCIACGETFSVQ
jgi:hypothetical protein